jgi:hypothetical protein
LAEKLAQRILERNARTGAKELKKFEVSHFPDCPLTFVIVEVGMPNDEGTMASVYCRDYRHIVIGRHGGLKLMNAKNKRRSQGWFNAVHALTR